MDMQEINNLLLKYAGVSGEVYINTFDGDSSAKNSSFFFKGYSTEASGLFKTFSVFSSPLIFATIAVELALLTVAALLSAGVNAVQGDFESAQDNLSNMPLLLLVTASALISVVVGPIANIIDLVGSGINTALKNDDETISCSFN